MSNLEISRAERLDQYVIRQFTQAADMSRGVATKLIAGGKVLVNGQPVLKSGYKLRAADTVVIDFASLGQAEIPTIELEILYEDDDCIVINKPLGLLTHSKGLFNPEATVGTWLRSHLADDLLLNEDAANPNQRAGIAHRLDRMTSGVMICAKNKAALSWIQKQFAQRRTKKVYAAIIAGQLDPAAALIDLPIERNPKAPQTFRVGSGGKVAQTEYRVLETAGGHSLLELKPTTGRTHQLRVHLAYLGHPIVGDTLYKGEPAERLFLHAKSLELTLPNRQRQVFSAPLPPAFRELLHA